MPKYVYRCEAGHLQEVIRSNFMSADEDPGMECHDCIKPGAMVIPIATRVPAPCNFTFGWEMVAMPGEPDVPTRAI